MAGSKDKKPKLPGILLGDEVIKMARKGKDAWNAWAAKNENSGTEILLSGADFKDPEFEALYFDGFGFPGHVDLHNARGIEGHFSRCVFNGNCSFQKTMFDGEANWFSDSEFKGDFFCVNAIFRGVGYFNGARFNGVADFCEVRFQDGACFDGVTFEKNVTFTDVVIEGQDRGPGEESVASFTHAKFKFSAEFNGTRFGGNTTFAGATFERDSDFRNASFEGDSDFTGATFKGPVSLEGCRFAVVPDFRRTQFDKHVTLHGCEVKFRTPQKGDADKYRRLKELAVGARDHDREQDFFACELKAKREFETRGLALVPNYLYEWTSNFGRSLTRPTMGLGIVWFAFGDHYRWMAGKDWNHLWDGLLFSAAQLMPFLGASRGALADAKTALFGGASAPLSGWVNGLAMIEGILGIVFLFLIGLALRNRFRI